MRPGRLDRILYVGPPDAVGREEILRIRTRNMSVEPGLDYSKLSSMVSESYNHWRGISFISFGVTDRRVLGGGVDGDVPGSGDDRYATRYQRGLCLTAALSHCGGSRQTRDHPDNR